MFGLQSVIEGVRDYRHVRPASVNVIEGDVRERCSAPCKYFDLLTDLIFRGVLHSLYVLLYYVHILVWALSFWAPCPASLCFRMCSPSTPLRFRVLCAFMHHLGLVLWFPGLFALFVY